MNKKELKILASIYKKLTTEEIDFIENRIRKVKINNKKVK